MDGWRPCSSAHMQKPSNGVAIDPKCPFGDLAGDTLVVEVLVEL